MKVFLWGFAIFGLLCLLGGAAAVAFFGMKTMTPEKVDKGLQADLQMLGVTLGKSTEAEVVAKFGQPEQTKPESLSTVYLYPSRGLLFRIDKKTGQLIWLEVTSKEFATARGIRLGATYDQLLDAYGPTKFVALLPGGTRVRYQYGTAYYLEFWLGKSNKVERISLYHS